MLLGPYGKLWIVVFSFLVFMARRASRLGHKRKEKTRSITCRTEPSKRGLIRGMYCIVLYCIVLYCIVSCIILCIVLYCILLCYVVLCCIVLYCIIWYHITLHYIVLYCNVLYCIVLFVHSFRAKWFLLPPSMDRNWFPILFIIDMFNITLALLTYIV